MTTIPHATTASPPGTTGHTPPPPGNRPSAAQSGGLLLLRLALGLTMAGHGTQKLFGWFDGGGIEGTGQFFTAVGYPSGEAMAVVAGLTETLGGLGLVFGLLHPLAGAAVFGTMLNALAVKWGDGFFAPTGVEYEVLLTVAAAGLTLTGPGAWALDRLVPGLRTHRPAHGAAAVLAAAAAAGILLLIRS